MAEPELADSEERLRRAEEVMRFLLERMSALDPGARLGASSLLESVSGRSAYWLSEPRLGSAIASTGPNLGISHIGQPMSVERLLLAEGQIGALAAEVRDLRSVNAALERRIEVLERSQARFAHEFTSLCVQLSRAPHLADLRFHRVIPVTIYLSETDPEQGRMLQREILRLLDREGFSALTEEPDVFSSWLKRMFAATKDVASSDGVQRRLAKVEEAVELKHIDLVKAERDKVHSEAVLNLSQAMSGQERGVVIIGSLLYIKLTTPSGSQIFSRTLTRDQQELLEMQPELQLDPDRLYQAFFAAKSKPQPPIAHAPRGITRKINLEDE